MTELTRNPRRFFILALLGLTLYRVLALLQPHLVLFYDEAYYYHWSLNLDWGYYSKPPMVAWMIWLFTQLFGDTGFAIKLGAPVLYGLSAWLVYRMASELWEERSGLMAGWVFLTMPLMGYNSLFITTDAPLVFFWALTLWLFLRALRQPDRLTDWILLGLACGAGMLSKYTMALLPLGLFLYLAFTPARRQLLATPGPWVAAVIAGLLFGGNIWWNFANDFVAFRHTSEISGLDKYGLYPAELAEFWGAQLVIFGPVWSLMLLWRGRQLRDANEAALWWAFWPLFGVISLQALLSHAFINWAAPAFVAASLLAGKLLGQVSLRWFWVGGLANLLLLSLIYHWPPLLDGLGIERSRSNDPYFRVLGWDRIGAQVAPLMQENVDALMLSDSRKLLAAVGFYAMPGEFRVAHWSEPDGYIEDYYELEVGIRDIDRPGQTYIWIGERPLDAAVAAQFAQVEPLTSLTEPVYATLALQVYLYRLQGFQP